MDPGFEELHHAVSGLVRGNLSAAEPLRYLVEVVVRPCRGYEYWGFGPLSVEEADKLVHVGLDEGIPRQANVSKDHPDGNYLFQPSVASKAYTSHVASRCCPLARSPYLSALEGGGETSSK